MKKNILYYIDQIEEKFLVCSLVITVILVFVQVIMRAGFNNSLFWSEELARYIFIWQCWISVSLTERYQKHIRIELLIKRLPSGAKLGLECIVIILTVGVCLFFVIYGIQMVQFLITVGTLSTALQIPMYLIYAAMPVGCVLYAMRLIIRFFRLVTRREVLA